MAKRERSHDMSSHVGKLSNSFFSGLNALIGRDITDELLVGQRLVIVQYELVVGCPLIDGDLISEDARHKAGKQADE